MLTTRLNESSRATATARAVRLAGMFLVAKLRTMQRDQSTQAAARYARKTLGLPLNVTLSILRGQA
jgi:hypothetical protein